MSTSSRAPFIGIGTGRCGTTSLRWLIDACANTKVTHEHFWVPWYDSSHEHMGAMLRAMKEYLKNGIIRGEIAQFLGPHVSEIRGSIRGLKVICLHRDKESTIQSFKGLGMNTLRPSDKAGWADKNYGFRAQIQKCFPLIDADTPEQAIGFYWEMYESMMARVKEPVFHMNMEDLNSDDKVREMFEFLDIPERDMVFMERRKWYTSEDVAKLRQLFNKGSELEFLELRKQMNPNAGQSLVLGERT